MKKGFTLIELLVVIAIIAMLSSLSVIALNSARAKSRDARRLSDIKQIKTALEMYYDQNLRYPSAPDTTSNLGTTTSACLTANGWTTTNGCSGTIFMQRVPADPQPSTRAYVYAVGATPFSTFSITYFSEASGATVKATESSMN
ncbi:MAG TPA: prepilin-type N-terminal cleavage/methylation domain-containing protein [bacterium]|nr:prepilin-type N-terminal cleavage/methylation domain-containing protein [bacterium]